MAPMLLASAATAEHWPAARRAAPRSRPSEHAVGRARTPSGRILPCAMGFGPRLRAQRIPHIHFADASGELRVAVTPPRSRMRRRARFASITPCTCLRSRHGTHGRSESGPRAALQCLPSDIPDGETRPATAEGSLVAMLARPATPWSGAGVREPA